MVGQKGMKGQRKEGEGGIRGEMKGAKVRDGRWSKMEGEGESQVGGGG